MPSPVISINKAIELFENDQVHLELVGEGKSNTYYVNLFADDVKPSNRSKAGKYKIVLGFTEKDGPLILSAPLFNPNDTNNPHFEMNIGKTEGANPVLTGYFIKKNAGKVYRFVELLQNKLDKLVSNLIDAEKKNKDTKYKSFVKSTNSKKQMKVVGNILKNADDEEKEPSFNICLPFGKWSNSGTPKCKYFDHSKSKVEVVPRVIGGEKKKVRRTELEPLQVEKQLEEGEECEGELPMEDVSVQNAYRAIPRGSEVKNAVIVPSVSFSQFGCNAKLTFMEKLVIDPAENAEEDDVLEEEVLSDNDEEEENDNIEEEEIEE